MSRVVLLTLTSCWLEKTELGRLDAPLQASVERQVLTSVAFEGHNHVGVPTGIEQQRSVVLNVDGYAPRALPEAFDGGGDVEIASDGTPLRLALRQSDGPWQVMYLVRPYVLFGGPAPSVTTEVPFWRRLWASEDGPPDWSRVPSFHDARRALLDINGAPGAGLNHAGDVFVAVRTSEGEAALAAFLVDTLDLPEDSPANLGWELALRSLEPEAAAPVMAAMEARVRAGDQGPAGVRARKFVLLPDGTPTRPTPR